MKHKRGLKTRTVISNAVNTELWERLKDYSNKTSIPLSKLLDKAINSFIDDVVESDDIIPENEENLFKYLKKNKDLNIRFSFFSLEEQDLIPAKISSIYINHAHIHNDIEFDDEDEYLDFLEHESGYDKKTIKKLKNEFNLLPYLSIDLEEKL